jgi:hypothetical protein
MGITKKRIMKRINNILTVLFVSVGMSIWAQQTPADKQSETISITGTTAHIGDGTIVENCTIVFADGKIPLWEQRKQPKAP